MPALRALPIGMRTSVIVGYVEAIGLAAYALSIAAFEVGGSTTGISGSGADLAPGILIGLYLAFAVLVAAVSTVLMRGLRRGLTPYLLAQAFAVVVAQPMVAAPGSRGPGVVLLVVALAAAVGALLPSSRRVLR